MSKKARKKKTGNRLGNSSNKSNVSNEIELKFEKDSKRNLERILEKLAHLSDTLDNYYNLYQQDRETQNIKSTEEMNHLERWIMVFFPFMAMAYAVTHDSSMGVLGSIITFVPNVIDNHDLLTSIERSNRLKDIGKCLKDFVNDTLGRILCSFLFIIVASMLLSAKPSTSSSLWPVVISVVTDIIILSIFTCISIFFAPGDRRPVIEFGGRLLVATGTYVVFFGITYVLICAVKLTGFKTIFSPFILRCISYSFMYWAGYISVYCGVNFCLPVLYKLVGLNVNR